MSYLYFLVGFNESTCYKLSLENVINSLNFDWKIPLVSEFFKVMYKNNSQLLECLFLSYRSKSTEPV